MEKGGLELWKMISLSKRVIFMFHVSFVVVTSCPAITSINQLPAVLLVGSALLLEACRALIASSCFNVARASGISIQKASWQLITSAFSSRRCSNKSSRASLTSSFWGYADPNCLFPVMLCDLYRGQQVSGTGGKVLCRCWPKWIDQMICEIKTNLPTIRTNNQLSLVKIEKMYIPLYKKKYAHDSSCFHR